jgi:acetaldehyde dehydrogenase
MTRKLKAAIIGSGNIGTDLMIKILRHGRHIEMAAMVGIDAASDGLARAKRMGVATTHDGVEGLTRMPVFDDIDVVFDATSAGAHVKNDAFLRTLKPGIRMVDLTPAAIGPYCIPVVNGEAHLDALNVNMVTCGGQATIPMVAAVSRVAKVHYAEIVVLNPAEPPLIMRDTVYTLSEVVDEDLIADSVARMAADVQSYVPGYRLKQKVQFDRIGADSPIRIPGVGQRMHGIKTSVFLEVEGAAHYLPAYAGNLDIMTSAALRTAESMAQRLLPAETV